MTGENVNVIPFALADRWIVTVEGVREFVRVRHRTRWYAVARRKGHNDRRHECASRADAIWIAEELREACRRWSLAEEMQALLDRLPPIQREQAMTRLWALVEQDSGPAGDSPI